MKHICLILSILVLISPLSAQDGQKGIKIEGNLYENESLGIKVRLTEGNWYYEDKSQGPASVIVLSNPEVEKFKFTIVMMPAVIGIKTAEDRDAQLSSFFGDKYKRVELGRGKIDNRETTVLVYDLVVADTLTTRVCTHVLVVEDNTYMMQVSGPKDQWEAKYKQLKEIFNHILFTERKPERKEVEIKEEEEKQAELTKNAKIIHHLIKIDVNPRTGEFKSSDRFTIRIIKDKTKEVEFLLSDLVIDSIKLGDENLSFSMVDYQETGRKKLTVNLPAEYDSTTELTLNFFAHKSDYLFTAVGKLIAGYNILGQVREKSSYSSHVLYYPVDEDNDATGEIWITVPSGYVAISVGKLVDVDSTEDKTIYHWKTDIAIPRILPFAFAVGEYEKYSATTKAGIPVEIYTWKVNEEHALRRLDLACDIIDFYNEIFGQLPFEKIAIIHVTPEKGMAGVSLPTMILLSDMFFTSDCSYEVIKEDVRKSFLGPLALADEISHQWNAYAVAFPNELAEGMAQYTDALFAEHVGGRQVLKNHIKYHSSLYKAAIENNPDTPIASPVIYKTQAYQSIAFSKGAVVLNMLRYVVGDSSFFAGMRHIFKEYSGKKAGYDDIKQAMEKFYGDSLDWFFEEWYRRTGYPSYEVKLEKAEKHKDKYLVSVLIKQTQGGKPFTMPIDISFMSAECEKTFPKVMVSKKEERLTFELDFRPQVVRIDKEGMLLKDEVYK